MENSSIHAFEKAGLGRWPFRFVGFYEKTFCAGLGAPVQPGSSCDYCGQGIRYVCEVADADGKRFKVGCDCVRKVEAPKSRIVTSTERAMRDHKRKQKAERDAARIEAGRAALEGKPELLLDRAHPSIEGKTMRAYVEWMLANAGTSGRLRACRIIEEATGPA